MTTNRLDIFVRGPGNRMFHKAWNGTQWEPGRTEWEDLGGDLNGIPAVVSWGGASGGGAGGGGGGGTPICNVELSRFGENNTVEVRIFGGGFADSEPIRKLILLSNVEDIVLHRRAGGLEAIAYANQEPNQR